MQSMAKYLILVGVAAFIARSAEGQADLDQLIGQVFGGGTTDNSDNNNQPQPPVEINNQPSSSSNNNNPLECQCVPYYLCKNNKIITDGVGLIDIRIREGPCANYLDVCCQKPNTVKDPITPKPLTRLGCGRRNPEGVGFRIRGDEDSEAQFGEFPWMVAILREENGDESNAEKLNVYQCGGALVHPQVVVTAAHCIATRLKDPQSLKVRAGEWDTQTKNELFPHQDRYVKKIVVHPEYYSGALYNDIGLLFLEQPVDLAENVDLVCLPPQGAVYDLSRCFASGWGKDTFGKEGRYQVILKKVELPVVPRDRCLDSLRQTRLGPFFQLHDSFICAGGENGKDTCKGDGGSPLVCPSAEDSTTYQQVGIVAWGIGCGENNTPGVYVNVPIFRDWIDEQVAYEGLNPSQ